jgi:hypothetical protein
VLDAKLDRRCAASTDHAPLDSNCAFAFSTTDISVLLSRE